MSRRRGRKSPSRRSARWSSPTGINEELCALPVHADKRCDWCGAGPSDAVLNLEAYLHHGGDVRCIDNKACRRRKRMYEDE